MRARAVQIILKRCLGHRDGEPVLLVTDTAMEPFARAFQRHAHALGVDSDLVSMVPRKSHGEEPSRAVAEALRSSPVAVLRTSPRMCRLIVASQFTSPSLRGKRPRALSILALASRESFAGKKASKPSAASSCWWPDPVDRCSGSRPAWR